MVTGWCRRVGAVQGVGLRRCRRLGAGVVKTLRCGDVLLLLALLFLGFSPSSIFSSASAAASSSSGWSSSPPSIRWWRRTGRSPRALGFLGRGWGIYMVALGFARGCGRGSRCPCQDAWRHRGGATWLGLRGAARWPHWRRGGFAPVSRSGDRRGAGQAGDASGCSAA
jgi:hypothetical protein